MIHVSWRHDTRDTRIHVAHHHLVLDWVHVVETPGGAAAAGDQSEVSTVSRDLLSANHSPPADHGAELPAGEGDEAAARALVAHQEVAEDEVRALRHMSRDQLSTNHSSLYQSSTNDNSPA